MAMLAGPKRKQKWTLNPQGKQWSEDSNKIGQKMLEKMGWSKGKGLGVKQQGITSHIKVKVKNDQIGLGCKDEDDKNWTKHHDSFNDFLQSLQTEQVDAGIDTSQQKTGELSGVSLSLKSKESQCRVHYKKFTQQKDVYKYSTKDLANILGKKDLVESVKEEECDSKENEVENEIMGSFVTINRGSISDYFKNKMSGGYVKKDINHDKVISDDELEHRAGFGYTQKEMPCFKTEEMSTDTLDNSQHFAKKITEKNENSYVFDNPCFTMKDVPTNKSKSADIIENNINETNIESKVSKKRKSKFYIDEIDSDLNCPENLKRVKKLKVSSNTEDNKNYEIPRIAGGIVNNGLDLSNEDREEKSGISNGNSENNTYELKESKIIRKLFKKSLKKKNTYSENNVDSIGIVNEALEVDINAEIADKEISEMKTKKSKLRKNEKECSENVIEIDSIGIVNEALEVDDINLEIPDKEMIKRKNKKSKIKIKGKKCTLETNTNSDSVIETDSIGIVNEALEVDDISSEVTGNEMTKRKNKKSKTKTKDKKCALETNKHSKNVIEVDLVGIDNEALEVIDIDIEETKKEVTERKNKPKIRSIEKLCTLETIKEIPESEKSFQVLPKEDIKEDLQENSENVITIEDTCSENRIPSKKSKKKRKHKPVEDENCDEKSKETSSTQDIVELELDNCQEGTEQKAAKVKRKKKLEFETEHNLLDSSSNNVVAVELEKCCDENEQIATEAKEEKKLECQSECILLDNSSNNNAVASQKNDWKERKSMSHRNPVLLFNGSNINEIKGYGNYPL